MRIQNSPQHNALLLSGITLTVLGVSLAVFVFHAAKGFADVASVPVATASQARAEVQQQIEQLKASVEAKKSQVNNLQGQIEGYNAKINNARSQVATLQNQADLMQNKITKANLDIQRTQDQIDQTNLEVQSLDIQIQDKTDRIASEKEVVAEYLRTLYKYDNKNTLEVLLSNNSFSEFFDQIKYLEDVEKNISGTVSDLIALKADLETERGSKEDKKVSLAKFQQNLEITKASLVESESAKQELADAAAQSQKGLEKNLQQLRSEQDNIDADLSHIQQTLKVKMRLSDKFAQLGNSALLAWPVDPSRGITTYFHDPDYPFRYVFEHPGLDIRAYQGTPVHSAGGGFVAKAHNGGMGYSYVMIVHPGGLSTVYGHLSRINVVEDQYIEQGQILGLSGATPGTPGAGPLTTGPHLHFEVRKDGIPVNPLGYLVQ